MELQTTTSHLKSFNSNEYKPNASGYQGPGLVQHKYMAELNRSHEYKSNIDFELLRG
jgi:hypothetical protein